ncbi:hypothetical protein [Pseudomonas sp. PGPR40]|uniref:hypothetical protein n=1 Tax=Pseudomonas sp. PGPR40 TaxID=2913476 RepID=UPI001EDB3764|nr:hypothetical protein [Pseudomonas sp. PGPR40]
MTVPFPTTNRTWTAAPTTSASFEPAPDLLAQKVSHAQNNSQHFQHPPSGVSSVKDNRAGPTYVERDSFDSDVISNQQTLDASWKEVVDHLSTQQLTAQQMRKIVQTGFLQESTTGKALSSLIGEAMMRSIPLTDDLSADQLRNIVDVVSHLPPQDWPVAFGGTFKFPEAPSGHNVLEYIQSRLK